MADVRLYREGLARALTGRSDLVMIGDVPVNADGIDQLSRLQPDVVLIEAASARLPTVVSLVRHAAPGVRVIAFAITDEEHDAIDCAEAGASGYVSRDATIDELIQTILRVDRGEFPCSPRVATLLARRLWLLASQRAETARDTSEPEGLTARERQIVGLIDEGLSNKEIASRLGIGVSTVKNHVHHILDKTQAVRRSQAAALIRSSSAAGASAPRVAGVDAGT